MVAKQTANITEYHGLTVVSKKRGVKKLSIFSAVHKMLTPKTSTLPHPPPGFNIFFIDFLGSS